MTGFNAEFPKRRKAFTIFELLVTMSIMALVSTIAVFGYQSGVRKQALSIGRSQVHTMLTTTRSQAILNGTDARLIINYDPTDRDRFLRYVGIVIRDKKYANSWIAVHRGSTLPDGVYFVPSDTTIVSFNNWVANGTDRKSEYIDGGGLAVMSLEYPLKLSVTEGEGVAANWVCYQFDASGKLESLSGVGFPHHTNELVFSLANYDAAGNLVFENSANVRGIKFRSVLHSYAVDDPDKL